jgi:APA family basic amino acid/polyamine antiporter
MSYLWRRKPFAKLLADDTEQGHTLAKTLGPANLIALGIGAIIGAGLFVRTAQAAAESAGPSVTLAFVIAAVGCAFAGLCYAEFASMIPIAGSAYTYSYATMGELVAWIIGWDLVLEYGLGAATVGIAWSEYLNKLLEWLPGSPTIPYAWCHSPFDTLTDKNTHEVIAHGIVNLPALVIVFALSLLLIRGVKESAFVNGLIVITKVTIVVLIVVLGWSFIDPANHTPYIPEATTYIDPHHVSHHYGGFMGLLGAAGTVFFAFIGFDAVSTAAQESRNPRRDMPIGILGSLAICTVLYILFAHVLTGIASVDEFRNPEHEASVAYAISAHMPGYDWLAKLVTVAILAGFSSVILVLLMGQSRVFFSMSRDGLVPRVFSDVHPKYKTPWKSNLAFFGFVGAFAAFVPGDVVGDMTSIGTLFAFVLVSAGVWILRVRHPEQPRAFKTPLVPIVPILGVVVNAAMIFGLGWPNWARLGVWLVLGMGVYFGYSRHHSRLAANK